MRTTIGRILSGSFTSYRATGFLLAGRCSHWTEGTTSADGASDTDAVCM